MQPCSNAGMPRRDVLSLPGVCWNGRTLSGVFFVIGGRSVRAMERPSALREIKSHATPATKLIRARKIKETDHDEDQHAYNRARRGACGVGAGNAELRATQRRDEQQPGSRDSRLHHEGREVQAIRLG